MKLQDVISKIDYHQWSSEPDVGQFIASLIKLHNFHDVVEIGVFKGLTTSYILDSLPDNGTYIGIDIKDYRCDTVKQFMKEMGQEFVLGDSKVELANLETNSADLIFLDGHHTLDYVKREFKESIRIIRKDGIICIHDAHFQGVSILTNYVKQFRSFPTITFNTSDNRGITVIKCKDSKNKVSLWFDLWFAISRNSFVRRVNEKITAIHNKLL